MNKKSAQVSTGRGVAAVPPPHLAALVASSIAVRSSEGGGGRRLCRLARIDIDDSSPPLASVWSEAGAVALTRFDEGEDNDALLRCRTPSDEADEADDLLLPSALSRSFEPSVCELRKNGTRCIHGPAIAPLPGNSIKAIRWVGKLVGVPAASNASASAAAALAAAFRTVAINFHASS